jgi:nitrite reductase (NO-forming)
MVPGKSIPFFVFSLGFLLLVTLWVTANSSEISEQKGKTNSSQTLISTNDTTGIEIYKNHCASCHQLGGEGISGAFPPLKSSDYLATVSGKALLDLVLNGSNAGLTVNGMKYSIPMPPQVNNYSDAVLVVNYIMNAWGNHYGKVSLKDTTGLKIIR